MAGCVYAASNNSWIIPSAKTDLHFSFHWLGMTLYFQYFSRRTAFAPSCPVFLPAPQHLGVYIAEHGGEWLEFSLQNWLGQIQILMSIVQQGSRINWEIQRIGGQFWMSHFWSDLRSTYDLYLSPASLNSQLTERYLWTFTVKLIKPVWNLKGSLYIWFWGQFNRESVACKELWCWIH